MSSGVRVTVAVLTYCRPGQIGRAVPALLRQIDDVPAGYDAQLLVIDNDPSASARESVLSHASQRVRYVVEPTPGISAARNRALDECASADIIVFIDDDELPTPRWLSALLHTRVESSADAVAGPVVSEFEGVLDPWIAAGGFLARRHRIGVATGTSLTDAATNNLLLDRRTVDRFGLRFDPAFGLTGGEDSLFTRMLTAHGARMVWCAEAVVTDHVPVARMRRSWVLSRAMSHGNIGARVELRLASGRLDNTRRRLDVFGRGVVRLAAGLTRAGAGTLIRSTGAQAGGMRTAARGLGLTLGAMGYSYRAYRRESGSVASR